MSMSLPVATLKCGADVSYNTPSITNGGRASFSVWNHKDGDIDFKRSFHFLVEDAGRNIEAKEIPQGGPLRNKQMSSAIVSGEVVSLENRDGETMEITLEEWDSVLESLKDQYGDAKFPYVKPPQR